MWYFVTDKTEKIIFSRSTFQQIRIKKKKNNSDAQKVGRKEERVLLI
jgi:hypothetical protein